MYITDLSYIELVEIEYPIPLRQSGYMLHAVYAKPEIIRNGYRDSGIISCLDAL